MERIERAFADAVTAGRFDRAAGWFAVARWYRANAQIARASRPARAGSRRSRSLARPAGR